MKNLMKIFLFSVFLIISNMIYAQNTVNTVSQLDVVIKELAANLNSRLNAERAQKIVIEQFAYKNTLPPLSSYLANQLSQEMITASNRSFVVISSGSSDADWIVSGEIVEISNIIRVYSRLMRASNREIAASFNSDLERSEEITQLLYSADSRSILSDTLRDAWETDSFENPVIYEIGHGANFTVMDRTLHSGEDEDFFLLLPNIDGRIIMETIGDIDTLMYFYDADTGALLTEDDDSGQGYNARIRYNVQAGKRYIAKVTGYGATTGFYGFYAYMSGSSSSSWENPVNYDIGYSSDAQIMNRTLHDGEDEDYFLLIPQIDGRLTIETHGSLDTTMSFFDADTREFFAEDDDSGQDYNARIRYKIEAGRRYVAVVQGYGSNDIGDYGFQAFLSEQITFAPDEYEPDDESSQAKWIDVGVHQQHNFHNGDDVDWVKFQIQTPRRYTIRTKGVISNELDTCIELYDANMYFIDKDDDGGEYRDSFLSLYLGSGVFFLKVYCLDSEPDQAYYISIEPE